MSLRMQKSTNEAQEMTQGAIDLMQNLPGLLGVITDAALRGQHNYDLMRAGLVPVNPIAATRVDKDGTRVEKTGLYQIVQHDHPNDIAGSHEIHHHTGVWSTADRTSG